MADDYRVPMPTLKGKRRVMVPLSDESFEGLVDLAWHNQVSIAYLGQVAILKLLLSAARGEFTLVPEFQSEREIPRA